MALLTIQIICMNLNPWLKQLAQEKAGMNIIIREYLSNIGDIIPTAGLHSVDIF